MVDVSPAPSLEGLNRMTDDCGMLQHSSFDVPNRHYGYCLDDNARALILMHRIPGVVASEQLRLMRTYAAFIEHAWCDENACFRNFMSYERTWLERRGSDDSAARAFWATCVTALNGPTIGLQLWGRSLVQRVAPHLGELGWPRSDAFALLGLCALRIGGEQGDPLDHHLALKSAKLLATLEARRDTDWDWFEDTLSYDNARLSEALILAGLATGDVGMQRAGARSLHWLCELHRAPGGQFRPVGTDGFGLNRQALATFDQQPLEAAALIDACTAAFQGDGNPYWIARAEEALQWFSGGNDLGADLTKAGPGECFDGLTSSGMNRNQGAESVIARQFALCGMAKLRESAGILIARTSTTPSLI